MDDRRKTKQQLIDELHEFRREVEQLRGTAGDRAAAGEKLRLTRAVEQSVDGIAVAGMDGVLQFVNPAWLRMHGYGAGDLDAVVGRHLGLFHTEDQLAQEVLPFIERLTGDGVRQGELGHVTTDGRLFRTWMTASVLRDEAGDELGFVAVARDVSDRNEALEALQRSEQRYRDLVEYSQGLICVHDLDGKMIVFNPAAARSMGYQPDEWQGLNLRELLAPEFRSEFPAYLERIRQNGTDEGVMRVVTRSGEQRFWAYHNILRDDGAQGPCVVAHGLDITDLKKAEWAVRESEARYSALVEHTTYGIYRSTRKGRFLGVNPAMVQMLSYGSVSELLEVDLATDVYEDPTERERLVKQYLSQGRFVRLDVRWKRKDGTPIVVRLSGRAVYDHRREFECFEVIAEDVTEHHAFEEKVREVQKMEAVGQLTGGIAHDFNNILTVILASADLLDAELPPELRDAHADLDELRAAARRGGAMVRKLLGFSRRGALTLSQVNLGRLVGELSTTLRRLLPESIEVGFMTDRQLPSVVADQGAVEQILMNLATNARDAMPKGGALRIETRRRRFDDDHVSVHGWGMSGEYVCISVADTGSGMDEETKRRIFEPFFTTKPVGAGTGLGMAMVYGLVKQQKGFVDIVSEVGEGTAVIVYFPATSGEEVVPVAEVRQELPRGAETILFIEDEASIRRAGRRALERNGYTVLVAKDGEEGLEFYHAHKGEIDIVISDMVMPRMSGPQVYQEIRRDAGRVKFLFMSGYSARDVRSSISIDPTIPFLHKPWTLAEMLRKVREVLDEDTVSA